MEHKKGKIYYSMGEVAEMFDVNASLIRFWESKFDILKPHKNKKGNRMFTPADVDNLKLIHHLVKEKGMTLTGAQKRLKENPEGSTRDMEITDRLLSIKAILMELRQELGTDDGEIYRESEPRYDEEPAAARAVREVGAVGEVPPARSAAEAAASPDYDDNSVMDSAFVADITDEDLALLGSDEDDHIIPESPAPGGIDNAWEPSLFGDDFTSSAADLGAPDIASPAKEEPRQPQIIEQTLF